ncbi:hypothetical protein GPECTOR_7g1232 [Gonium pectorale]|uniref:Protein kinase domain-containing protein n=1 Tax=Gonium pectorale TaxID=33097 RepID=A0A150GUH3_GONPE|nr:hypothetical protein GPECTOR_7g1232 [Gonium pectorale]|eukprot:KXZ53338.1 hypothetical protein GPECTOR_7g1232 [Gonium pectorale]
MASARSVRELGCGGFGSVHLVEVTTTSGGRMLAARKTLLSNGQNAAQLCAALTREVRANMLTARTSPFAPAVLGIAATAAGYSIFTEFAENGSLGDRLERVASPASSSALQLHMPVSELRKIAFSVLHALSALNDKGYAHLDIKPANVLISGCKYMLADYGICDQLCVEGKNLGLTGSWPYVSPEQWSGKACRLNVDCFTLGISLAQCAVWPAGGRALTELVKGERPLPDCVPEDLREFLGALTERDPARRPSAKEALRLPFLAGLRVDDCL